MWDLNRNRISGMALALCVVCIAIGFGLMAALGSRVVFYIGLAAGVYLLFSIKVADQWEKVAVLRVGRYIGLRGP